MAECARRSWRLGLLCGIAGAAAACLPHAGFETGRVTPAGSTAIVAGGGVAATVGKRHDYRLENAAGQVAAAGSQHQPYLPVEAVVLGRVSRGLVTGLELDASGWNPLLLPPIGLGGALGLKGQLVGGRDGAFAVAVGVRAGGFVNIFGTSGNSRFTSLGFVEGRAAISVDLARGVALSLVPLYQLEAVYDRLIDAQQDPPSVYRASGMRAIYGVSTGVAAGTSTTWFLDLASAFAPRTADDPAFSRWTIGIARRLW